MCEKRSSNKLFQLSFAVIFCRLFSVFHSKTRLIWKVKFIPGFSFAKFFVLLRLENFWIRGIYWTSERHQNVKRMLYSTSLTFKACVKSYTCDCTPPIPKLVLFHYFYISHNIPQYSFNIPSSMISIPNYMQSVLFLAFKNFHLNLICYFK